MMRILWVGKPPGEGAAGDEIFDRRTIAALRARGHAVTPLHPRRVGRGREALNLLRGVPHYRSWFDSPANRAALAAAAAGHDATIVSWEPHDLLRPPKPALLVPHNVTSRALPALYPGHPLVALLARRARGWERSCYRAGRWSAIAALSARDHAYLAGLPDPPPLLLTRPGMPPAVPLAEDAVLRRELVVSGTFGWAPKRRDLLRFAAEYGPSPDRLPVHGEAWPAEAARLLAPLPLPEGPALAAALRLGIITDRFEAGHKLKTLAHIAGNQIVLSFADVAFDFADIPDHEVFIRRIGAAAEIAGHVAALAAMPAGELRQRFRLFQRRCAERFTWDAVAAALLAALGQPDEATRPMAAAG